MIDEEKVYTYNNKTVGDYEVSDTGIETIVEVDGMGGYTSTLVMSKEAFIEAYEKYIKYVRDETTGEEIKVDDEMLEQESCEDVISRQSAIFLADDLKEDLPDDEHIANMVLAHNEGILEYQTKLSLLPPVNPQTKTGHWNTYTLSQGGIDEEWLECSECMWSNTLSIPRNYCPNCGCKMEVKENGAY